MRQTKTSCRCGLTLIELVTAMVIGVVAVMTLAVLLSAGQRNWTQAYNLANKGIQIDALQTMISFGSTGRRSNKTDYRLYKVNGSTFTRVTPPAGSPVSVVNADAVEFRFWDGELTPAYMDSSVTATRYALFYLDGTTLKMDIGPYDSATKIGGVTPAESGSRTTGPDVTTRTIAENVTSLNFSHTTKNAAGDGDGSVRIDAVLTDPQDGRFVEVKAATLIRNVWP